MKKTYHISWFLIADLLAAFASWLCFFYLRKIVLGEQAESVFNPAVLGNALIVALYWLVFYFLFGHYKDIYRKSRFKDMFVLLGINLPGVIIIFFTLLLDDEGVTQYTSYYKTFAVYYLVHSAYSIYARVSVITLIKRLIRNKKLVFNTIIVGSDKNALEIYDDLKEAQGFLGMRFLGFVKAMPDSVDLLDNNLKNFGTYENLPKLIRRCYIDQIIIALEASEYKKIQDILNALQGTNVKIGIIPDIYQLLLGSVKVNHLFGVPIIEINQDLIPQWQKVVKRSLDITFSSMVLCFGAPVYGFLALMTKVSSSGPVFYMQERVGREGKPFKIVKFRSMHINAELNGPALASDYDNRITSWGKWMRRFRFDELPQFYNVLKGDMSLVGPRPERNFFIDQIIQVAPEYRHLHKVRPGLTSLGQVKFGYAENVDQMVKRLKYDVFYIENMSLAMDFRIIFYTVLIILQGRGK